MVGALASRAGMPVCHSLQNKQGSLQDLVKVSCWAEPSNVQ